ncbi:hypothetical protein HDV01_001711 [Terramyces sp. JEL0728]|nr:hypothetical protein HDV01_001711 [Terramyces sp. JEL0728]
MKILTVLSLATSIYAVTSSIKKTASAAPTKTETLVATTSATTHTSVPLVDALTYNCTFKSSLPHHTQSDGCPRELVWGNDTITINIIYDNIKTERKAKTAIFNVKNKEKKVFGTNATAFVGAGPEEIHFDFNPTQIAANVSQLGDVNNEYIVSLEMILSELDPNTSVPIITTVRGPSFAIRTLEFQLQNFSISTNTSTNPSGSGGNGTLGPTTVFIPSNPTATSSAFRVAPYLAALALIRLI